MFSRMRKPHCWKFLPTTAEVVPAKRAASAVERNAKDFMLNAEDCKTFSMLGEVLLYRTMWKTFAGYIKTGPLTMQGGNRETPSKVQHRRDTREEFIGYLRQQY